MARRNKYNAKKITIDGHNFPSKREAERYCELKLFLKAGLMMSIKSRKRCF